MTDGDRLARFALRFLRFLGSIVALVGYLFIVSGGKNLFLGSFLIAIGLMAVILSFPEFLKALRHIDVGEVARRPYREPFSGLRILVFLVGLAGVIAIIVIWGISIGFYFCICLILIAIVLGEVDLVALHPMTALKEAASTGGVGEPDIQPSTVTEEQDFSPKSPSKKPVFVEMIQPSDRQSSTSTDGFEGGTRFCPWCALMNPEECSYCQRCGAPLPVPI
jgi:hypothetical protein